MLVGVVGKPNVGKSTFFSAATLIDAPIAPYPFTTIQPNKGVTYVRAKCPHLELGLPKCDPNNSRCEGGVRLIPMNLLDVAGLVPDAHLGKGMGNQFMDDLRTADCLIQVVDASGRTDAEGRQADFYDPCNEVRFLEDEIAWWLAGILKRSWAKVKGGGIESISGLLSGLKISQEQIIAAASEAMVGLEGISWSDDGIISFCRAAQRISKPIIIAANKIDVPGAEKNLEKMKSEFPSKIIIPCSAESELTLRRAAEKGLIRYIPGDADFQIIGEPNEKQKAALEYIRANILRKYGSTGVQELVNGAVFRLLRLIAVYPVEDEHKYANHFGKVLPDAFLVPSGTTALQFAGKIHTDLASHFIHAVDARKKMRIGKEHALGDGDVVRIVSAR